MSEVVQVEPTSIAEVAAKAASAGGPIWVQYEPEPQSEDRRWRVKIAADGTVTLVGAPTYCWEPVIEDGVITGMRLLGA